MYKRNRSSSLDDSDSYAYTSSDDDDETVHYKRPKLTEVTNPYVQNPSTTRNFTITLSPTTTISTLLTSHPGHARKWLHATLNNYNHHRHRLVGLGVQWVPSQSHASTIQLCIGRHCLIFSLNHAPTVPNILRRILNNPTATFVGVWCHSDAHKLMSCPHRLAMRPCMPVDVREFLDGHGLKTASIQEIGESRVGLDIGWDNEVSLSDWDEDVDEFSFDQVKQASLDAYVAFTVGMQYQAWKLNPLVE